MATLELRCGRCGYVFMRWTADLGRPFDEQTILPEVDSRAGAVRTESPGGYRRASDGNWYRWAPGEAAELPDGETWSRYVFTCPTGCPTSPQHRVGKLEDAAMAALRWMHETRTPFFRMTPDELLRYRA